MLLRELPSMDPTMYGLSHEYIANEITVENYASRAIIRVANSYPNHWLYLWIRIIGPENKPEFLVRCTSGGLSTDQFAAQFDTLAAAVHYINGGDATSTLARLTRPATPREWPPEFEAASVVGGWSQR